MANHGHFAPALPPFFFLSSSLECGCASCTLITINTPGHDLSHNARRSMKIINAQREKKTGREKHKRGQQEQLQKHGRKSIHFNPLLLLLLLLLLFLWTYL